MTDSRAFWISWYSPQELGAWELHSPWWISGERCSDDALTLCAAVQAADEDSAKAVVVASYDDKPAEIEWRFVEERPEDWAPFSDRFSRAAWMKWPGTQEAT